MKKDDVIINTAGAKAKVKWVVDWEVGILMHSGESAIIDSRLQEWKVLEEAPPVYQTSIEHMSDEQLRASIEELRGKRLARPPASRIKKVSEPVVKMSEEDKKLTAVLKGKSPEELMELKRKLGLVD